MFLRVKRARIQRELLGPQPGDLELGGGQHRRHEIADGEGGHLNGDLCYDEWLGSVSEELVEEG